MAFPLRSVWAASLAFALVLGATNADAGGVSPAQATAQQRDQAQARFLRGKDLYGSSRFDAALAEFSASFEIVASPNTRLYIGRCQRELGKLVLAYDALTRTALEAKEDPKYEKTAEAANEERAALEPKLGLLNVSVTHATPETTLKVGGEEIHHGRWTNPIPVMPGSTEIVVETPGRPAAKQSVQVTAGEKKAVAIDAEPAPTVATTPPETPLDKPKYRPHLYAAGGVAIVGLATFVIAGTMANGTESDLEKACGGGPCPPGHEDDISSGRTQQTIANVGLVFAIVGAVAAGTIFVLDRPKKADTNKASATRFRASPSFVGLGGSF